MESVHDFYQILTSHIMHQHINVRRSRKQHRLTQDELADLIGLSQGNISRLESGETPPDLEAAFSLEVVFGSTPRDLFPALYGKVEDVVMRRAATLDQQLVGNRSYDAVTKSRLLKGMVLRAKAKSYGR
jgi:transcriptional regulator with XRE-family HTH domain